MFLDREDPDSAFALVRLELEAADVAFCQVETTYSERCQPNRAVHVPLRTSPANVPVVQRAGFGLAYLHRVTIDQGMPWDSPWSTTASCWLLEGHSSTEYVLRRSPLATRVKPG